MFSPSNPLPQEPQVPPEVPAEYADAYLAGFRRGLTGLEPEATTEHLVQEPPEPLPDTPASPTLADPAPQTVASDPAEPEDAGESAPVAEAAAEAAPKRGTAELGWLFDRGETGPPGWTVSPRSPEQSTGEMRGDGADTGHDPSGSTVVAGEGPRSPWPLVGAFVVVLLLLMLLAYLAGMAFSTIMNR